MKKTVMQTLVERCSNYKRMDRQYGTDSRSPLHHDRRCVIHRRSS